MAVNGLISMRESSETPDCIDDILYNIRILEKESVQNYSINLKELTGVDTDDIANIHATLQEVLNALRG